MVKGFVLMSSFLVLTACSKTSVEGTWVESVPGMADMQQGFVLEKGGKASSINMATLQYESWKQEGNLLILSGQSIGNHQTISFSDTLVVELVTPESLTVKQKESSRKYLRSDQK